MKQQASVEIRRKIHLVCTPEDANKTRGRVTIITNGGEVLDMSVTLIGSDFVQGVVNDAHDLQGNSLPIEGLQNRIVPLPAITGLAPTSKTNG